MKLTRKKNIKTSPLWLNTLAVILVPIIFLFTCEWIHRGKLNSDFWINRLMPHASAFLLAWLMLVVVYLFFLFATYKHFIAAAVVGILTNIPAVITRFKLQMRGEPFLPWDILQIEDFLGVAGKVKLKIQTTMVITLFIFFAIVIVLFFVKMPNNSKYNLRIRLFTALGSGAIALGLLNFVFLNSNMTVTLGIYPDMWMQDRYYKNHGVVTGFLTNLQALQIDKPEDYTESNVKELEQEIITNSKNRKTNFPVSEKATEETPNIIFLMNESFWDVSRLPKIVFDRDVTKNLKALESEAAYGYCYTPSFGGGTCDVEFEALTGFSLENLPAGAKPYQQHVTKDMFSLPQYLKNEKGYETLAIHGYYRKFWSRNSAYPRLGIDTFISSENFINPELKRGFISDAEMTRQIIEEMESHKGNSPLFIHAVTMQNHTTYDSSNYPSDQLVNIVSAPPNITERTLDELSDFATGVYEADAALGQLVEYLKSIDDPTILVFFGDHFNPIGVDYELYEKTGFIQEDEGGSSPALHETSLSIWSNYANEKVELGTIAAYNISPIVMELFNLDKPLPFEYLLQQLPYIKARTRGITVNPDNSKSEDIYEEQKEFIYKHSLMQYDLMFGEPYFNDYVKEKE